LAAKPGPKPKITERDRAQIEALIRAGRTDAQIAAQFNVSRATINRLRHFLADNAPVPANPLAEMIARNAERRAILDEIGREHRANGESAEWARLWRSANAA
jgi:FixJ family two-component response regulator